MILVNPRGMKLPCLVSHATSEAVHKVLEAPTSRPTRESLSSNDPRQIAHLPPAKSFSHRRDGVSAGKNYLGVGHGLAIRGNSSNPLIKQGKDKAVDPRLAVPRGISGILAYRDRIYVAVTCTRLLRSISITKGHHAHSASRLAALALGDSLGNGCL